jgi:hypothetical protein
MNNKDYLRCILLKHNLDIKNHKLEIKVHFNFNNWLADYVDGTIPIMYDLSTYVIAVQYTSILIDFPQGLSKEWTRFFMTNPNDNTINKKAEYIFLSIITLAPFLYLCKYIFYELFIGGGSIINNEII